jgi:hypothetical protein
MLNICTYVSLSQRNVRLRPFIHPSTHFPQTAIPGSQACFQNQCAPFHLSTLRQDFRSPSQCAPFSPLILRQEFRLPMDIFFNSRWAAPRKGCGLYMGLFWKLHIAILQILSRYDGNIYHSPVGTVVSSQPRLGPSVVYRESK